MAIIKGGGYRPPSSGGSSSTPSNPNSVYIETGFTDLADLQSKNPTNEKKLYLTDDNKLYRYVDGIGYEELTSGGGGIPDPHTHVIGDVEGLQAELDTKLVDTDLDSIRTDLSDLTTELDTHTHVITDVGGLQEELENIKDDIDTHTHEIADTNGLQEELDNKADLADFNTLKDNFDTHTHEITGVNGLQEELDTKLEDADLDILRTDLGNLNTALIAHKHVIADVDGLGQELENIKYDMVFHTHTIAEVDGLQTALDGKVNSADFTSLKDNFDAHNHVITDVDGLQAELDGLQAELDTKAKSEDLNTLRDTVNTHTHEIEDVVDLQVTLDGKTNSTDFDALRTDFDNHTHEIGDVTDLQSTLDSKASATDLATLRTDFDIHTHVIAEVDGLQTVLDNKVEKTVFDSHTHEIESVNGLQEALDLKANATDIPTNVSQLTNDAQYSTEEFVTTKIAEVQEQVDDIDLSVYATKDDLLTKADTVHTHEIADVNGLRDELDSIISNSGGGGGVPLDHTHEIEDVIGLQTELDDINNELDTHTHEITGVTGLQEKLDTLVSSDALLEFEDKIVQSDLQPEGIEEGRLWIDTSEDSNMVQAINNKIFSLENRLDEHLLVSEYRPYTGSLKDINYTTQIYAHGTATDRPSSSRSFFVDVKVRGDNPNYRVLVARAHSDPNVYTLRMINGVWDSEWYKESAYVESLEAKMLERSQYVTAIANSQTIPNSANTDLVFYSVSGASWASLSGGKVRLKPGKYHLLMSSLFNPNGTGNRAITGHTNTANMQAVNMANTSTRLQIASTFTLTSDTNLDMLAFQNSGSALSVSTSVHIMKVGD